MCLYIDWARHHMCRANMKNFIKQPKTLREDMVVYKLLIKSDNKLITPFQNMVVATGKEWGKVNFPKFSKNQFVVRGSTKTDKGYHAYVSQYSIYLREMALGLSEYNDVYLCKCIIPKGSYVYYGVYDDICSNSLVIKEEDVELFHKGRKKIIVNRDIIF